MVAKQMRNTTIKVNVRGALPLLTSVEAEHFNSAQQEISDLQM